MEDLEHWEQDQQETMEKIPLAEGDKLYSFDINVYRVRDEDKEEKKILEDRVFKDKVPEHYRGYRDVFNKRDFDQLPERRVWDHAIELTPNFKPIDCKVYPLNPREEPALKAFIKENLKTGRIRPLNSPTTSPFFFTRKADRTLRPVQDYRKLNKATVKNHYPLPLIGELIDKLKGARVFSKLDVQWGYNNVRIKEGDEWKAAFRTNQGLFEPTVMFFGL